MRAFVIDSDWEYAGQEVISVGEYFRGRTGRWFALVYLAESGDVVWLVAEDIVISN